MPQILTGESIGHRENNDADVLFPPPSSKAKSQNNMIGGGGNFTHKTHKFLQGCYVLNAMIIDLYWTAK